jgi:hypothetical protein
MKDPAKYLKEGMSFPFLVLKDTLLPDGKDAWVLRDIMEQKILLEKENYPFYTFPPGSTINCRVDKINCSGKVFLEPPHPFYEENKLFEFDILKLQISQGKGIISVVRDVFGHEINVDLSEKTSKAIQNDKISLKVKFIKKGIPFLMDPELEERTIFEEKREYNFRLEGVQELMNGINFYVLTDEEGGQHFLPEEWYLHYKIAAGQEVVCEVVKILAGGKPVLEPVHPEYKRGEHYQMAYLQEEEMSSSKGEFRHVVVVSDTKGQKFYILKKHFGDKKIPRIITCRVEKYRKGKVFFEPVDFT